MNTLLLQKGEEPEVDDDEEEEEVSIFTKTAPKKLECFKTKTKIMYFKKCPSFLKQSLGN